MPKKLTSKLKSGTKAGGTTPFAAIAEIAAAYGERSFENYAVIRSVAENMRAGLCQYLDGGRPCVFLVPPQGPFTEQNYGSGAFSVTGKGFLPLEPISFGLGVRVSHKGDFLRIVVECRKEGEQVKILLDHDKSFVVALPLGDTIPVPVIEGLYQYLLHWFESRIDQYDDGHYGTSDIGFDILHIGTGSAE